jgi:hypothetical protein
MKIDLQKWAKEYEKHYQADVKKAGAEFPIFISDSKGTIVDKSPYFETVSKLYQNRGCLRWKEFCYIGLWKTRRQRKRYELNFNKSP